MFVLSETIHKISVLFVENFGLKKNFMMSYYSYTRENINEIDNLQSDIMH